MEQIIERMQAALIDILRIKTSLEAERSKVAEQAEKQDKVTKFQTATSEELELRETAVRPIEDLIAYKEAAEALDKKTNDERIELENAKNRFKVFVKDERSKITTKIEAVNKQAEFYKRELAALQKAKEEVAKEKESIKGKVLGELANKI